MHPRVAETLRYRAGLIKQQTAHSIQGTALDAGREANLLEADLRAAAEATAEDTTQAADAGRTAEVAAAAQVAQRVAAAEEVVEAEFTASAEAQQGMVTAIAVAVARENEARAAGIALAAREAAAALLTDDQWARSADRTSDLGEHELATPAREARASGRAQEMEEILAAAAERDSRAEARDRVAEERERVASLRSFLGDQQYQEDEQHAGGLPGRRAAGMDRIDARTDRACAASDRARLSAHLSPGSGDEGLSEKHMSELAAQLSHDLRVPLSTITASVEMLEDELGGHSEATVAALLGSATRAGDRMVRMLDQHMTPRAAGDSLALPEVDLAEVVRQLLLDSAAVLEPVGAVVETGELPVVRADPDGMYSVLQNLLTNAVKFARPGVPARVRISARRSVDGWRICVRDNGVGLPEDGGLDVFSLFSRGTSAVAGHGIGLATVARVVAAHGGRVGATPVETGAEIWFEMPDGELVR